MKENRVNKVLEEMKKNDIPQMIISDPAAIFYLTGKWINPGERLLALYLNINGNYKLFVNELFPITEDLGIEVTWFDDTQDAVEIISKHVEKDEVMGIDKNWPSRFLLRLMELGGGSKFVNSSFLIDQVRMCKDEEERELMREASRLNDKAVEKLIKVISSELSEKDLVQELNRIYDELGAEGFSFDPIIAFGANAADPHGVPGNVTTKPGDSIVLDIGCVKDYYCSDMTRTVFYKEVSEKSKEIYNIVLEANKKAIEIIKPGVRFCDIDAAARDHIEKAGYGKYFTHRTGHSIGAEVHEFGDVSSVNTDQVKPGMIFSVEPGIYIPGEVGVRIEDLVLVTEDGHEILNDYDKELIVVE
ncbi:Xaa-Pro peptidase family protein [Schnuerera sp. xch1]|uniref:M24 family metallopeptidase n=1 Tax=Schnuerera sp. xch1 TaxID=2874283 RepID=UPI001CC09C35|nr:Xaa-Pro peptidase family protein [Schnuerera sp. xch1]MBZ2175579.1 Xaa-Pro peptidase family protein [Schnuerera sp. xch1]